MTIPEDCVVRLIDLPPDVGGFITESPDGCRNIYINARYSEAGRREALRHELLHAENDDLHSAEPVAVIEARASQKPSPLGKVAPKGSDEVPSSPPPILSTLIRAADLLLPPPPPTPSVQPLTPHQARVLLSCLSDLDRFVFAPDYDY